jgi:hypothetical protein
MKSVTGRGYRSRQGEPRFSLPEIKGLLRATQAAGLQVFGYEIDPVSGRLIVNTGGTVQLSPMSALDQWVACHADSD